MATEMTTGLDGCQEALMQRPWVNTVRTSQGKVPTHQHIRESDAALHKNPITQKHTYRRHENSTKRQEGAVVWASKRWWGRGMKKEERGREKKKKTLILPSQQTASGVPACQFHWAGEVEHCSVSDLHSVYYAVTGAPRPRGGLLNSNMHRAALFSLTTSWALPFSAA